MSFLTDTDDDDWVPTVKKGARRARLLSDSNLDETASDDEEGESFESAQGGFENNPSGMELCPSSPDTLFRTPSISKSNDQRSGVEEDVDGDTTAEADIMENSDADSDSSEVIGASDDEIEVISYSSPARGSQRRSESRKDDIQVNIACQEGDATVTSTPSDPSTSRNTVPRFRDLNVTAIPAEQPNVEFTVPRNSKNKNSSSDESKSDDQLSDDEDSTPRRSTSGKGHSTRLPFFDQAAQVDDDDEDVVVRGIENITNNAVGTKKRFQFQRKEKSPERGNAPAFDEDIIDLGDDEDSEELSANFDMRQNQTDSGNGDSDIQVVFDEHQRQRTDRTSTESQRTEVISLDADHPDELDMLTERIKKIPLGQKQLASRKAILLDEPPPIRDPKIVNVDAPYNPRKMQHEEFFGDVRRTVSKLAETIETMPMPQENYDHVKLPPMAVPLYNHQIYGLEWLSWREREFPGGGILADEMGLGKTIMILSLIMKSKIEMSRWDSKENSWMDPDDVANLTPSQSTLVVCPLSCIIQWEKEISNKTGYGKLKVVMFHGPHRTTSARRLADSDVVLTTYSTIASEIPKDKNSRSPLKRVFWHRIVLDEAHQIRNPKTVSALAICQLYARHRWAVTGTPVHNRPEDFFSMVKFLRMTPFDDPKVWDFWIGMKQVKKGEASRERLHILGKALILRRTKEELQASNVDSEVNRIPPKTIETIKVDLNEEEQVVFNHLKEFAAEFFNNFLKNKEQREREMQGAAMAYTGRRPKKGDDDNGGGNFAHIFALIVRLRQCVVLPYLIEGMLEDDENSDLDESEIKDEIERLLSKKNPIFSPMYMSSKISKILEDLEELREKTKQVNGGHMDKVIIVSSWTKLLDILHLHLRKRRFSTVFITGREDVSERTENMTKFNENPNHPQIALLSLQAGAVGINLIGGNHVFFVEPHWNPQIELQAQDRVHRFGQKKDVTIRRYITEGTIEDRIMELQAGKMDLAHGILANTKKTRGGGLNLAQMRTLFDL